MTNNLEKQLRGKLTKWLQDKGETPGDVERKTNAWLRYFDEIRKPVVALAACTWLCSGTVILPEDLQKVEQAVRIAEINRVDPLRFDRPMAVFEAFPSTELKEAPINPDTVPTLHLARRFDTGLAIYDVDETKESRKNMRQIINTHFGKDSSPWCLLQGDGEGKLTKDSLKYWNRYNAYIKQVAFVDGKLAAFSANGNSEKVWWDRMDESHEDVVVSGRIKEDLLGRSASCCFNPETGDVRYEDIIRRRDDVFVERYVDIEDRVYILDILVDPKKKEKITSVVIPGSVTKIGNGAFAGCSSLQEIHIPDSVKVIGNAAFDGCTSLQEVHVSATAPQALIGSLRAAVPDGCTVLRDLPEENLAALRGRGVSESAIRELQENGSVHIKEKTFYRPATETSPCPAFARTVHTDVVAALENGSVRMKDPKIGKVLGGAASFFATRRSPQRPVCPACRRRYNTQATVILHIKTYFFTFVKYI